MNPVPLPGRRLRPLGKGLQVHTSHLGLVELPFQDQALVKIVIDRIVQTTSRCGKDSSVHCLHAGYTPGFQTLAIVTNGLRGSRCIASQSLVPCLARSFSNLKRHVEASGSGLVSSAGGG